MRIGVSLLNFKPGSVGGIETYIRKVIEHAPLLATKDEVVFFVHRANRDVVPEGLETVVVNWSQRRVDIARILEACTFWRAHSIERLIANSGVDVMLYTQQSMFPMYCPVPSVLLVADVQYLFSPRYYSWMDLRFRKSVYLRSLKCCSKIISISSFTAGHLSERCGVPAEKIEVVHLGFDPPGVCAADTTLIPEFPYLYYPAATHRHKGHAQLFRTFARLKRDGQISQKLLLSGGRNDYWRSLEQVIAQEEMQAEILHLGHVTYSQVMALYQGADAVVFPTEFEGFGIPVLEAALLHKKIICSTLPVFDELGVPRQWQIDYSVPEQLLNALQQEGPTRLLKEPISWKESVQQNMDVLRSFVSHGGNCKLRVGGNPEALPI
jgi:glycosyltransferase involved in cell wall biosynthesis